MEISVPIPLARLPRGSVHDGTHLGTVHTVRDGAKRRRKEICAAVDGDSLSLYEIQNGIIIASYPVPPTSRFLGPPCSIREKVGGQNTRTTYCAIKRDNSRIECFKTSRDEFNRPIFTASPALRHQESPVTLLELVSAGTAKHVLVVQQNGNLTILSEDLQTKLSEASLSSQYSEDMKVLAIQNLTLSEAYKTILKQRPDVASTAAAESFYLAVAYGQSGQAGSVVNLRYGVWTTDLGKSAPARNAGLLSPLFEHGLPLGANKPNILKDRFCTFSAKASSLFVRAGYVFLSYDLTGLVPTLASTLNTGFGSAYEIMAISSTIAICSLHESLQLYDLKYQSVQAQRNTKQVNLKRKRNTAANEGSGLIQFVAYYPQFGRIIGRRRHQLLAIDVSAGPAGRLLESGSKLLQNIGRGLRSHETTTRVHEQQLSLDPDTVAAESTPLLDWELERRRLDHLAQAGDVAGFEDAFFDGIHKNAMQLSASQPPPDTLATDCTPFAGYMVNYLLSKIFQVEPDSSAGASEQKAAIKPLRVRILSTKLILWVSRSGLLSGGRVGAAIASAATTTAEAIPIHAVAQALLDADPSCTLLMGCLTNGFSPYVEEQAAVVQLLIQQALDTSAEGEMSDVRPKPQANGTMDVDLPFPATEMQVQSFPASSSEDPWLSAPLQRTLIAALNRFGTAAALTISSNLKTSFSQREVLALTQFLRQQLFQAGHTRSFQSHAAEGEASQTVKLNAAVKILSGCVDAIGPLGFFSTVDNEDFIGNIIPELATEIENTKRSLEDASELQGILREAMRYQESIQRQQASGGRLPPHVMGDSLQQRPGAIATVYSEAVEGDESLESGSALPLSLKVENVVNPVKIRKGGGQVKVRSVWQKRMLERRNKGQYSFERLVL